MREKELILLDVKVSTVLHNRAFRAELANGHEIVVFARPEAEERVSQVHAGDRLSVRMSPFDMSRGEIVF